MARFAGRDVEREVADHQAAQKRGRTAYYEDYTLYACADPRIHRFARKEQA